MDITDTSFEEVEPSFLDSDHVNLFPGINKNRQRGGNIKQELASSRPHPAHSLLTAPLSTASSGRTAFSDEIKPQEAWRNYSDSGRFDDDQRDYETVEDENDDEFLDDFEEFQNRKDNFDEAIKTRFNMFPRQTSTETLKLTDQFDNNLHITSNNHRQPDNRKIGGSLRQPKSMMDLKPRTTSTTRSSRLKNSISYGNLRNPLRHATSVRFKKSMPNMAGGILEEEPEYNDEVNESVIKTRYPSDYYLNKFGEEAEISGDDNDFIFDSSMSQPQLLPKFSKSNVPLKLSPSIYNIQQHNNLLTPQLHKRKSNSRSHFDQLENFRESSTVQNSRRPSGNLNLNQRAATYRMRTIKQQIDHNTPVKKGDMYYNPESMKWEGNGHILKKFEEIDSSSNNPLLIKKNNANSEKLENVKIRSQSRRPPEVVNDMMFDEKNLRWVSLHEEPPDPFAGIDDIVQTDKNDTPRSPFLESRSQMKSDVLARSLSVNPNLKKYHSMGGISSHNKEKERYRSLGSNESDAHKLRSTFTIGSKLLEHCYHEENRWNKKIGAWFLLNNKYNTNTNDGDDITNNMSMASLDNNDYMYEIRKMVMNSTNN